MESLLAGLSETHREVVVLCRVQGHSNTEAAEILGLNANTVRSRLARAQHVLETRWRIVVASKGRWNHET